MDSSSWVSLSLHLRYIYAETSLHHHPFSLPVLPKSSKSPSSPVEVLPTPVVSSPPSLLERPASFVLHSFKRHDRMQLMILSTDIEHGHSIHGYCRGTDPPEH